VNIGTVYHYFPDKTAILIELFRIDQSRRMAHLLDKLNEVSESSDLDAWSEDVVKLALELRKNHPATAHLRRAFRAVPELVELDRVATEEYLAFFSTKIRLRFPELSLVRVQAATRLLIELTAAILDVAEEPLEDANDFLNEGITALRCYLHSLDAS
jgi:AcrR family transcriptional regulator